MRKKTVEPKAAPWLLRPFFWNQRRKYGRVLDAARVWARAPRRFLGVALLYGAIDRHEGFARYRRARPDALGPPAMAAWLTSNNLRQTRIGSPHSVQKPTSRPQP